MKVIIIEDDKELRETYVQIIREVSNFSCVGAFSNCESAIDSFEDEVPDIILMDIGLPGMSGIEGAKVIKSLHPSIEIIMLTIYEDEDKIFQSICAGVSGYILKNSRPAEIVRAMKEIHSGAPMSAPIARRIMSFVRQSAPTTDNDFNLTTREIDILQLIVEGNSDRMIAEKLFISTHTVNSHLKSIYAKLHVHSKPQAVSAALKHRIV
jgi:DNA-binding NarL/FixJ family response regulator